MPRSATAGELTILNAAHHNVYAKLEIKNASGTWKDYTSLAGKDYFLSARLEFNVDSPVWSLTATLKRDGEAATESLSPLRGDSTLNVNDALAYAPAINAAREWRMPIAVTAAGVAPTAGDWKELCAGYLDKPDFTNDPLSIEGRSVGARLMDQAIRVKRTYSGNAATVAQQIITDNVPSPAPTLYVPAATSFTVTEFTPYGVSVMDALVTLALSFGWMIRDVYDPADSTMKTALLDPGRSQATADWTIAPTTYRTVDQASLDVANIRNYIEGEAIDAATGGILKTFARDPASIAAFGGVERYMKFSEDATSPIDTFAELQDMVDRALADLSTPKFDHTVTSSVVFWPVEICDIIDWTGNAVHYDTAQRLAVFGVTHIFEAGDATTQFQCRGTPAGAYLEWIRRQGPGPEGPVRPPAPQIDFVLPESASFGEWEGCVWVGGRLSPGTHEAPIFGSLGDSPDTPPPDDSNNTLCGTIRRPEGGEGFPDMDHRFFQRIARKTGFYTRLKTRGVRDGVVGPDVIYPSVGGAIQVVDPIPTPARGVVASLTVTRDPVLGTYAVTATPASIDTATPSPTGNWMVFVRQPGLYLDPIPISTLNPVTLLQDNLDPGRVYSFEAFIWNNGVSGAKRATISEPPVTGTRFTANTPRIQLYGSPGSYVPKVYIEGTTDLAGADQMAIIKSVDKVNTVTFGLSGATNPFTGTDDDTSSKFYRLVALNSGSPTVAEYSEWVWFDAAGIPGSEGAAPPAFVNGTPKVILSTEILGIAIRALLIQWEAVTSGAVSVVIQESTDNGAGDPWADLFESASVAAGQYLSQARATVDSWYRLRAKDINGTVIATSASVHFVP